MVGEEVGLGDAEDEVEEVAELRGGVDLEQVLPAKLGVVPKRVVVVAAGLGDLRERGEVGMLLPLPDVGRRAGYARLWFRDVVFVRIRVGIAHGENDGVARAVCAGLVNENNIRGQLRWVP